MDRIHKEKSQSKPPSLNMFLANFAENIERYKLDKERESSPSNSPPIPPPPISRYKPTVIEINDKVRSQLDLEKLTEQYNSYIKDNFFKITASLENYNFEFKPTIIYLLVGEYEYVSNYIVCVYNLKMTHKKTEEIIESNIPYYMSNGLTNHLRANLLLPFICFNIEETKEDCPYYFGRRLSQGGLFKYGIINNLKIDDIQENINGEINKKYLTELVKRSDNKRIGILSFVGRIDNLLDFLICLNNKNIFNYEERYIQKYHPIINNILDELNMDVISKVSYDDSEDEYKKHLLFELKRLITDFKKLEIINFEQVDIKLEKDNIVTKSFFNKYINNPKICKDHILNEDAISNVNNYGIISKEFGSEINLKLNFIIDKELQKEEDSSNLLPENLDNFIIASEFDSLIDSTVNLEKDLLNIGIEKWEAKCYKKYLKYKTKYIKLKKDMNKNI